MSINCEIRYSFARATNKAITHTSKQANNSYLLTKLKVIP